MTHIKQQKYFWHPTSTGLISLLLIYTIRPWPFMRTLAWSQWIAIYLHIRLKYIQKHKAYAASYNNIKAYTLKAFFVRATKHWSIVGLVRQSCYTNNCWCSSTVSERMERWHNRTALINPRTAGGANSAPPGFFWNNSMARPNFLMRFGSFQEPVNADRMTLSFRM